MGQPTNEGLFEVADAVREDGAEVTVRVVVAKLDRAQLRRVRAEAAALDDVLAVSRNPFVLPLLHHDRDATGRPVLVTARRGPSLADEIAARGPLSVATALSAVLDAATGLELLHRTEIVHQAVSPATLLRQPTGRVVLDCPLLPVLAEIAAATTDGTGHEPPEELAGQDWTPVGEVYSLASTLWTLLSGRPPFSGRRSERVLFAGQQPPGRLPEGAARLTTALRWALASEPGARPRSVAEFARRLRDQEPPGDRQDTLPPRKSTPSSLGGEYELLSLIGEGGMGKVWRARRRADGMLVAAKVLRPDLVTDADSLMRLVREGSVLQDLDHPHLVRVLDLHIAKGRGEAAVVMDLVEGVDLRQLLSGGQLGGAEGMRLLAEVASGLDAVHRIGVVHRDLKPENILVREHDGRRTALLTDFGLVKAVGDATVTRLGYLPGTPAYLAPELINREPPSPATDVYALGVTTYEVVAGHRPFSGTQDEILVQHQRATPPRPPQLPEPVWAFLTACLAKDPRARPGASEATDVLRDLAREVALAGPDQSTSVADAERTVRIAAPVAPPWLSSGQAAPPPFDPHAVAGSGAVPTETSARLPDPRPPDPPDGRGAAGRRRLVAAVLLVAALGAGLGIWLGQRQTPSPDSAPPSTPRASPVEHRVPVRVDGDGERVTVRWPAESGQLPGLISFVVFRNEQLIADSVPGNVFSYQDLDPFPSACYVVIALGVTTPAEPSTGPACLPPTTTTPR